MKKGKLDEKDLEILKVLEEEKDPTNKEIAKKTGMSHTTVSNRIKKMKDLRMLPSIDYSEYDFVLGLQLIKTKNKKGREKAIKKLLKCPRTIFVSRFFAEYDIVSIFILPNQKVIEEGCCEHFPLDSSEISEYDLVLGVKPLKPQYLQYIPNKGNKTTSPCGIDCTTCKLHKKECPGCPATKHFDTEYFSRC
ncbi:MAG: DNA-binding transcriptional regulator Lrp family [Candidatus Methanohalarchaeum thermophilum]|uniref:DNA-binding transcriptional regulator Lrp family n=1 Tax=Methanohalarchaeum thermophilum TaxID=1903181 RepID=A0A1Q6DTR9_METT1|nr:MAG: DNA-binding transcriptional regulator Lrp family [Candidatus Methanohalarchaeum thermophilum]